MTSPISLSFTEGIYDTYIDFNKENRSALSAALEKFEEWNKKATAKGDVLEKEIAKITVPKAFVTTKTFNFL